MTRGSIRRLSVGSAEVDNVCVLIQDLRELRKIDAHIVGIAGQNFLSHFNYLVDYRKHVVRIELGSEIQDSIKGDHVAIEAQDNRMLVLSEAQAGGNREPAIAAGLGGELRGVAAAGGSSAQSSETGK